MENLLVPFIILVISIVFSMLGVGGGLVYVPLFFFLGFPVHIAISTSLLLNGLTTLSAAVIYIKERMVDIRLAAPLIISSGIGAPVGAYTTSYVDIKVILALVSSMLIFGALRMWFSVERREEFVEVSLLRKLFSGSIIGFSIGFIAGLLGVGGGMFIVPLLIFALKIPTKISVATTAFIVVFSSFTGFITHYSIGHFDLGFALPVAVCAVIGGQIGSRIMVKKLSGSMIRRLFGIVLFLLAIKLIHTLLSV
jgi:uncharacterized membrane protein YfcA